MRYRIEEEGEDNSQRRTREHNCCKKSSIQYPFTNSIIFRLIAHPFFSTTLLCYCINDLTNSSDTCGASTPAKVGHTLHPRDNTSIAARIPSICSDRRVRSRVSGVQLQRHAEIYNFFSFNYEHQYFCSCLSID